MKKNKHIWDMDVASLAGMVDDDTAQAMKGYAEAMLGFVERYESKEDYWFAKYYEATCMSIFTMGGMANLDGDSFWINPDEPVDDNKRQKVMQLLDSLLHHEMCETFKGREELAFRLFAYGTQYVHAGE